MWISLKRNNGFLELGEGKLISPNKMKLKEGLDANLGMASGIQQAQAKARQLMNQNPGITSASADAGKIDGQNDKGGGEGMKVEVPVNASGQQLANVQRMAQTQGNDDVQIQFTKTQNGTNDLSTNEEKERKYNELRENSVGFSKRELSAFLRSI